MALQNGSADTGLDMATRSVDSGGRVALTDEQQELLEGEAILTPGLGSSIRMFSVQSYQEFRETVLELWDGVPTDLDFDEVSRQLLDIRIKCNIDKQGRLRIPNDILDFTQFDSEKSRVHIIYRAHMGYWEIWPAGELGEPQEPDDPFAQACRILSERARQQRQQSPEHTDNES